VISNNQIDPKLEGMIVNSKFYIRDQETIANHNTQYVNRDIKLTMIAHSLGIDIRNGIHIYRALQTLREHIHIRGWIKLDLDNPRNRLAYRDLAEMGFLDYVSGNNLRKRLTAIRILPKLRDAFPQYTGIKRILGSTKTQSETPERKSKIGSYMKSIDGAMIQTPLQDVDTVKVRFGTNRKFQNGRVYLYPISFMSKAERKGLQINGNPSIELDYISMHPNILYRFKGIKAPIDCYANSIDRSLGKSILLICLNAESFQQGYKAIIRTKAYTKLRFEVLTRERQNNEQVSKTELKRRVIERAKSILVQCIDELRVLHKGISEYLFSGVSKKLMYIESEIALNVIDRFFKETGRAILSIHDSFIVEANYRDRLSLIMREEFDRVLSNRDFLNKVLLN
jgi:hypothetical protein